MSLKWSPRVPAKRRHQRGFLVPLAAILLVGIATLAVAIGRFSGQVGTLVFQGGIASQAYYAADSAAQYAMNQLYLNPAPLPRAATNNRCAAVDGSTLTFNAPGLSNCSSFITCRVVSDPANTTSYYTIRSDARCGAAELTAQRVIEVGALAR